MSVDRDMKRSRHALAGALALAATAALANPLASQAWVPQDSMRLAVADSGQTVAQAVGSNTAQLSCERGRSPSGTRCGWPLPNAGAAHR